MTLLYYHPTFLEHDTGSHPENAERLRRTMEYLHETGLAARCDTPDVPRATLEHLTLVHDPGYVARIEQFGMTGQSCGDPDTVLSPRSYDAACLAVGAAVDATERVIRGEATTACCLVRPPGHHACPRRAMGFCLFNNAAIAARWALRKLGVQRVLIVDWDVHHGNGTQDVFWDDPHVGFFSIHRWPFYPGTGSRHERGDGEGKGTTCNIPVPYGTPRTEYLSQFREQLEPFADRIRPELVIISAGYDSHQADPIGSLGLETDDFATLTCNVMEIAAKHAEGRIVSVLEGGYNIDVLARCVAAHLEELLKSD